MKHLTDIELQELADIKVRNHSPNQANLHLLECSHCAERLQAITQLSRSLKNIGLEHTSKDFTSRVIHKIGIKEAPSFAWKVLTNLAPLFMLTIVLIVIVSALQVTGATNNQEINSAIESARTTYSAMTRQISSASTVMNSWIQKLLPFAFAKNSTTLTIFLLCFFIAIALLDKHFFARLLKRSQTT